MNLRLWLLAALIVGLGGCMSPQTRLQSEEDGDRDKPGAVETIGDVTQVANADPILVSGVGLVAGLDGTGGDAPPGGYRSMLEDQLRKQGVENVKEVLASPTTSLVLVSGVIPPGARKGDPIDLEITVPRESRTRSLRGGRLIECSLYDYNSKKNLDPSYNKADGQAALVGHPVVKASGPVVVGFGDGDEAARERRGRIWGGGRCRLDRPLYLVLKSDRQLARIAKTVADRTNETFHGSVRGPATDLATAETKSVVLLRVAPQYRLNLPRYLRVVRLIPLRQSQASQIAYRRRLEEQLLDPAHTVTAALRLEAVGQDSIPTLKRGLKSEQTLVRFCSAEALAYLGDSGCGEELAAAVRQQPALRAFALTAFASLDEAICHVELRKLLAFPSAETRYGAFRALRALDEHEDAIPGEHLNESFWLHHVAPGSPALVHMTTVARPEIVLFGDDAYLVPSFGFVAGEFTITAGVEDQRCTVARTSARHGTKKVQCSLKLEDVLRTLTRLGGTYSEAVELLRQADHCKCLSCEVAVDALPQAVSVYDLARAGAGKSDLLQTSPDTAEASGTDFNPTPTLFEKAPSLKPQLEE
jgi:Flagellar P-ring protein